MSGPLPLLSALYPISERTRPAPTAVRAEVRLPERARRRHLAVGGDFSCGISLSARAAEPRHQGRAGRSSGHTSLPLITGEIARFNIVLVQRVYILPAAEHAHAHTQACTQRNAHTGQSKQTSLSN